DAVFNAKYQPTAGSYFIFSKDVGGGEFFQFYRYDFSTNDIALITDGKSRNTDFVWSHAGDRIAFGSTRRNGNDVDLYTLDPTDLRSNHMLAQMGGGGWRTVDWSFDDRKILGVEEVSANESYVWIVDATTGEKSLITPKGGEAKVAYGTALFSKDGKGIYVTTDKDSEFQRLAYIDLGSGQYKYLTGHITWDVEEFDLSDNGKRIAFVSNEDGLSVLHLLETATGKEHVVSGLPQALVSGVHWHKNNRDVAFNVVSARSTSDVYSLDADT